MKEKDLQTVIYYFLNNNRTDFLQSIIDRLPQLTLTNFYPDIEQINNEDLSLYLTGFLKVGNHLNMIKDIKILYNPYADNFTTSEEIFKYIKDINDDKSEITITDLMQNEPKTMEWLQSIGDFFGGSTEPETSTTTTTTEKTNWLTILSIMVGLIGFAFLIFKFYRKSPVARKK